MKRDDTAVTNTNQSNRHYSSGGRGATIGNEYQIDVSVWLALHLATELRIVKAVQIEPLSYEDLEADISENDAPGRLTNVTQNDEYTLVVQAKFRTAHTWTSANFRNLLSHGGKRRKSAADRLKDRSVRYLLVTNASLNSETNCLRISDQVITWPTLSPSLTGELGDSDLNGRVAVLANLDEEKISYRIKELLSTSFRVPHDKWEACWKNLRDTVRSRMSGAMEGNWTRQEIEDVIRQHGGYFASSPDLKNFVPPSNWDEIRETLKEQRAVVIVGSTGTGKSLLTRKLVEVLRDQIPGMAIVSERNDPRQLHGDRTEPPVLYEVEDPWGRLVFEPQRLEWNQQLQSFLETRLRGNVHAIVTSRNDVASSAQDALSRVKRWVVHLEPEHYGDAERERIFANMAEELPRPYQRIAGRAQSEVLSNLGTPLEIRKFFDTLVLSDLEEPEVSVVREAIAQSHTEAIERNISDQIEQRQQIRSAATVWALLKIEDSVPISVINWIEEALYTKHKDMSAGVMGIGTFSNHRS